MKPRTRTIVPDPIVTVGEPSQPSNALVSLDDADLVGLRRVKLGERPLWLYGCVPRWGEPLNAEFSIPPARRATEPLTSHGLRQGLVFISTLPNIEKHACTLQIVGLEEHALRHFPGSRICHVSSDAAAHWSEVDDYHSEVRAEGYSLCHADAVSALAFRLVFGVGVRGSARVAHGLFALLDGKFLTSEIPSDQYRPPAVSRFLHRVIGLLDGSVVPNEG